jgi:tellurite resistance protein
MGMSGLSIAYEKAYHLLELPKFPFEILLFSSVILFFNHIIVYGIKAVKFPEEIKAEFMHPIRINFFPAISVSLLLLSIAFYSYFPVVSIPLWFLGTILHTIFTFYILSFWIRHNFEISHFNPAWFIPIVGNIIIPIVGVDILGSEVMIFYFTIGIFFWIVLFTIILYRIIFHNALVEKFLPTMFILIAPPAVGFISYIRITLSFDFFAHILLFIALFFTLLLFFMGKSFLKIRYFVSWWAYTFPLDAITIASMVAYQITGSLFYMTLSYTLLFITTVVILAVGVQTLIFTNKKEVCIKE